MLSVVINTLNEEKILPRAISSVKKIADEIIVVDTESTDRTVEVAKKLGAKVFHHKNPGYVEPVRNFSISKAEGEWVLLLDADEEIPATLCKEIPQLITTAGVDYYRIPRKNLIFGKWIKSEHWWPDYTYRLFKKDSITWDDTIHSIPFTKGVGRDLPVQSESAIIHHSYSTISQYLTRLNRYTDHQLTDLVQQGYNFRWQDVIKFPVSEFLRQYFARKGYRDGLHGLALSLLQAFSELTLYLKLWERSDFISEEVTPSALNIQLHNYAAEYKWWTYQLKIDSSSFIIKPFWKLLQKIQKF